MKNKKFIEKIIPNPEKREEFSQMIEKNLLIKALSRWADALKNFDMNGEKSEFIDAKNDLDAIYRILKKRKLSIINRDNRKGSFKDKPTKEELLNYREEFLAKYGKEQGWKYSAQRNFDISGPTLNDILKK